MVCFDADALADLKALCERFGENQSQVVRKALRAYLRESKPESHNQQGISTQYRNIGQSIPQTSQEIGKNNKIPASSTNKTQGESLDA